MVLESVLKKVREKLLRWLLPGNFFYEQDGWCPCCDSKVTFKSENSWLRDHLLCLQCGCIPRERALMKVIEQYFPGWRDLHIHESSPANRGASAKLKNHGAHYVASQYYPERTLGEEVGEFRNEDLEQQTYADESFDLVITQDVMEHLYDPGKAFSEIARTLKKGGAHIFTVPILNRHHPSEVWATKGADGEPIFLHTPEYHGNPINPKGSPVTMHWGFDIVSFIKQHSGMDTTIEHFYDPGGGIWAEFNEVMVSRKV